MDDPDNRYSPVPGGLLTPDPASAVGPPPPATGWAFAPAHFQAPDPLALRRSRRRRRVWTPIAVLAAAALLASGSLLVCQRVVGGQQISDRYQLVTIHVPFDWTDETDDKAGTVIRDHGEDVVVPDIEAGSSLTSDYITVFVDKGADLGPLNTAQSWGMKDSCDAYGCSAYGRTRALTINGRTALQQTLTHPKTADYPASIEILATIRTELLLVQVSAIADLDAPAEDVESRLSAIVARTVVNG